MTEETKKEPGWLSNLAAMSATATAKRERDAKRRGSSGAASPGHIVAVWSCRCGWSGGAKELKLNATTFALACPRCGKADGLRAEGSASDGGA